MDARTESHPCRTCGGEGYVTYNLGPNQLRGFTREQCGTCHGIGQYWSAVVEDMPTSALEKSNDVVLEKLNNIEHLLRQLLKEKS